MIMQPIARFLLLSYIGPHLSLSLSLSLSIFSLVIWLFVFRQKNFYPKSWQCNKVGSSVNLLAFSLFTSLSVSIGLGGVSSLVENSMAHSLLEQILATNFFLSHSLFFSFSVRLSVCLSLFTDNIGQFKFNSLFCRRLLHYSTQTDRHWCTLHSRCLCQIR